MDINYDRGRFSVKVWGYGSDETRELSIAALHLLLARAAAELPPAPMNITQIRGDVIASAVGTGASVEARDLSVEQEDDRCGSVRLDDLALLLREMRSQSKITQAELARRIGISPAILSQIETGKRAVTAAVLRRLIEALR